MQNLIRVSYTYSLQVNDQMLVAQYIDEMFRKIKTRFFTAIFSS